RAGAEAAHVALSREDPLAALDLLGADLRERRPFGLVLVVLAVVIDLAVVLRVHGRLGLDGDARRAVVVVLEDDLGGHFLVAAEERPNGLLGGGLRIVGSRGAAAPLGGGPVGDRRGAREIGAVRRVVREDDLFALLGLLE